MIVTPSQTIVTQRGRFLQAFKRPYSRRLGFAEFFGGGGGGQTPIPGFEHWQYRIPLTINNAQASTLANVPVLIKLTTARFNYAHAQSAGQDIRVFNNNQSAQLAHEIEAWNDASGNSWIWTSIPSLPNGNTTIYLYYGNSVVFDGQQKAAVWNANYTGVWHLGDAGGNVHDSTAGNLILAASGSPVPGTGQVDGGANLNGSTQYYSNASLAQTVIDNWTMELWINPTDNATNNRMGLYLGTGSTNGYGIGTSGNTAGRITVLYGNVSWDDTTSVFSTGVWQHIVAVRSTGTLTIYRNAVALSPTFTNVPLTPSAYTAIGWDQANNKAYGGLDEARISNAARNVDWITFQYNSQIDNVITYGAEQNV